MVRTSDRRDCTASGGRLARRDPAWFRRANGPARRIGEASLGPFGLAASPDGSRLYTTELAADRAVAIERDPVTGAIGAEIDEILGGSFDSVRQLELAITKYLAHSNENAEPLRGIRSARQIRTSIRHAEAVYETVHSRSGGLG